jgi:hypothetical protein
VRQIPYSHNGFKNIKKDFYRTPIADLQLLIYDFRLAPEGNLKSKIKNQKSTIYNQKLKVKN